MYNEPESNPHVDTNNAHESARQEFERQIQSQPVMVPFPSKPPYPMIDMPARLLPDLREDKGRLDFLESYGATWHIPFIEDGPFSFDRDVIDAVRRKLGE